MLTTSAQPLQAAIKKRRITYYESNVGKISKYRRYFLHSMDRDCMYNGTSEGAEKTNKKINHMKFMKNERNEIGLLVCLCFLSIEKIACVESLKVSTVNLCWKPFLSEN